MRETDDSEGPYVLNTTALVGFFVSGGIAAVALFTLPLFVDTSSAITFDAFRQSFIVILLVEGAAALGVLYFGMRLYQPGPAADGGRGD